MAQVGDGQAVLAQLRMDGFDDAGALLLADLLGLRDQRFSLAHEFGVGLHAALSGLCVLVIPSTSQLCRTPIALLLSFVNNLAGAHFVADLAKASEGVRPV